MTAVDSQLQQNQGLRSWPFRRREPVLNENTNDKIGCKTNRDSQFDVRYRESFKSIFMTDSSKTIPMNERNLSQNSISTTTSMTIG